MTAHRRIPVDGLPITECRLADVRQLIRKAMVDRIPQQFATVNLNYLRLSSENPLLREVLLTCSHRFADGWPVVHLARRSGYAFTERVTGADLVPAICRWAQEEGWRVAFVGGGPELRGKLTKHVQERFGIHNLGHWQPTYTYDDRPGVRDPTLAAEIAAFRPDIVLVALGCPKQDVWLAENLAGTGAAVGMGVGGSFDFLIGRLRRAPNIAQRLRLEFLHRALQEPRRLLPRYRRDLLYYLVLRRS
jgi:N-acetylglucosaminyldiphosphoundecaprenol N-acetyl-beta-D-mannosaminyltransferase